MPDGRLSGHVPRMNPSLSPYGYYLLTKYEQGTQLVIRSSFATKLKNQLKKRNRLKMSTYVKRPMCLYVAISRVFVCRKIFVVDDGEVTDEMFCS